MARCGCGALVEVDAAATTAGQDQWAQCDACGKWREVDDAQLAAIEVRQPWARLIPVYQSLHLAIGKNFFDMSEGLRTTPCRHAHLQKSSRHAGT